MRHLKLINEKIQAIQQQAAEQGLPLNVGQVAELCIEYADALTELLDAVGLLKEAAPVEQEKGA